MHAIKGGWVGQTFALAKGNDSGRRKSRIRRSKEERKEMVESFIKKYQKSNDGNFPSLNLTHKEVGGSFYTVREIVREIIQENRVLGPAKLTPEEQHIVELSEQYPLGSISLEPQVHLSSSVETDSVPDHHQIRSEELVLDSSRKYTGSEHHIFDNGWIINGSHMEKKNEESDMPIYAELEVAETSGAKNALLEEVEVTAAKVTDIAADVVVETFPLRSFTKPSYSLDGELGEASIMTGILEEKETEKVETETGKSSVLDGKNSVEDPFGLVDEKAVTSPGGSLLEMNSGLIDEEAVKNVADPLLESSNITSINKDVVHDDQDGTILEVKTSHGDCLSSDTFEQSQEIAENKNLDSPNGIYSENMTGSSTSSACSETISEEAIVIEKKPNIEDGSIPQKGSSPTLDRINLESWEGASKKSTEPETNPFLAFIKAFVAGFVKFWSE
ncbi:uncharacterized protein LOC117929327 [Vitis riparia]|uniref:uncharacterized protein LOC117929327 n=1 Tax=Vitis riparia TaxID=96939 RepID=UPI00155AB11A|nr:uncharacterized protein LOC117929327 [Vitis riparia]XP_034705504.1 uncharacterized protein LOC117929327 [Vitis riparia]